jgi:hypothetical protein
MFPSDFVTMLVVSFAGGAFGAAIGGLPSFVICGVLAVVGLGVQAATGDATFVNLTAWGPLLSPGVAFVGGVAAAAYAAKAGKLESGGKDIVTPLMGLNHPDVLLVGGVFGALGSVLIWLNGKLPMLGGWPMMNPAVFSILVTAVIVRLLFGKTGVLGKCAEGANRWVPSEVAGWLPWQESPLQLLVYGLGYGLPIAFLIKTMPAIFTMGFAIAAVWLLFLGLGMKMPVGHHIGISAGMAMIITGDIWWSATFAVLAAFMAEFGACLFHYHGDTHIDPPSLGVLVTWFLGALLSTTSLKNVTGLPALGIAVVVSAVLYFGMSAMKARRAS